jgi:hypothetical protein
LNSKDSLRIRFAADPEVVDQKHFKLSLYGDFVPNPPAPPADDLDTSGINDGINAEVENAIKNGVAESPEAKDLEKAP